MVLYKVANNKFSPVQYSTYTSGSYTLNDVEVGKYLLYAIPDPASNSGWLPTYYVDNIGWIDADVINVKGNTTSVDIKLRNSTYLMKGDADIVGVITVQDSAAYEKAIYANEWFGNKTKAVSVGNNAMNITVFLLNRETNEVVGSTLSDSEGNFSFIGIPDGTYYCTAEKAGFDTKQSQTITIEAGKNITGDNVEVSIKTSEITLNVGNAINASNLTINVSPNPVDEELNLTINTIEMFKADLSVYNVNGSKVLSSSFDIANGKLSIPVSQLSKGVYIGALKNSKGIKRFKFIKK